jgi:ankyrin repeat protein
MVTLGLNVNVVALGQRGESPLHQAVKVCNLQAVEWLISHRADVNLVNRYVLLCLHKYNRALLVEH